MKLSDQGMVRIVSETIPHSAYVHVSEGEGRERDVEILPFRVGVSCLEMGA